MRNSIWKNVSRQQQDLIENSQSFQNNESIQRKNSSNMFFIFSLMKVLLRIVSIKLLHQEAKLYIHWLYDMIWEPFIIAKYSQKIRKIMSFLILEHMMIFINFFLKKIHPILREYRASANLVRKRIIADRIGYIMLIFCIDANESRRMLVI